ncbi:hypothetical protein THASP1DRAFT_19331 [Thamnocephalis sphaerospora]|uniref:Ubiquitin-activating enzyme E1-like n=1 Tax=Thamnocephalis sphaerospora TaxID=78915 RepID=A0A4V1IVZ6_9FUNG|nr:hypothetical protein THASP1DRAFT_19331 [Thamnocephalis sphaerospora]|eukprot:RKP05789.1 hypothetical protein THASP1DRAFT_19331 [Thamnocephalis sphaerospora]
MRPAPRLDLLFGPALMRRVSTARVLMVGAGGIGCELLKNLVMSGFTRIDVIDLDTIDLSNLNRQFLFQKRHIKQSKAHVARDSALRFHPAAEIQSHHANIKDERFDVDWFRGFDLVTNALDNLGKIDRLTDVCSVDARRHVNRMCLAANVPLIESGTAGYLGQATVIQQGSTECFECQPKPTPKTFPICTIRSTPTAPIHCIVWAKSYLFTQLFDRPEDDEAAAISSEKSDTAELESLRRETEALARIREAAGSASYPRDVFTKVFRDDIVRLASVEEMWQSRAAPVALDFNTLQQGAEVAEAVAAATNAPRLEQRVWSTAECFRTFVSRQVRCFRIASRLGERISTLRKEDADASIAFDKDDADALDFVTAASNLRAQIFGIEQKSRFDVKAMAGSIIPAIATTNAIIAGVIVMQAMRVLERRLDECKTIYLAHGGRRDRLFYSEQLSAPNPTCYVCRNVYVTLPADTRRATLRDLVHHILAPSINEGGLGLGTDVSLMESGRMLYDADWDDNLDRTLESLGLTNGKMLTVAPEDDAILGAGRAVIVIIAQR